MPTKEALKERVLLAEDNLRARDSTTAAQVHHPLLTIARVFRSHMDAAMNKATFNEGECAISDLINEIGDQLRTSGYLSLRGEFEAWYHACGVEAR